MNRRNRDFAARLAVPTFLMGMATLYWASLLDARMREQNLILIQPVVIFMAACYLSVLYYEFRRFRRESGTEVPTSDMLKRLPLMAVAVAGAACFWAFGAIPATMMILVAGLLALGVRDPLTVLATSLLGPFFLWLIFIQAFGVRMPLLRFF